VLRSNSRATTQHQKSPLGFEAESQYTKTSLLKSSWYNCLPRITQDSTRTSNWSRDSKDLTVFKAEFLLHESQSLLSVTQYLKLKYLILKCHSGVR
jgi:hypothetical protein